MSRLHGLIFLAAIFGIMGITSPESSLSNVKGADSASARVEGVRQLTKTTHAATSGTAVSKLQDIPIGKVIQVGFVKFVKAADNAYIATDKVECPDKSWFAGKYVKCWDSEEEYTQTCTGSNYCYEGTTWSETLNKCIPTPDFDGSMQTYSKALCDQVKTPTSDGYTDIGTMIDARDGTSYVIRKYADGRCWMAENLKFGSNCTYTAFSNSDTTSLTGYVGTYGNYAYKGGCLDDNADYDGYYYNWEAAMNNETAVYQGNYDNRINGTTLAAHDICPMGWHVATGGSNGEYQALANVVQGSSVGNPCDKNTCTTAYDFFYNGSSWNASGKSNITGYYSNGSLSGRGSIIYIWSSTLRSSENTYNLFLYASGIWPANGGHGNWNWGAKFHGFSVRCVLDN